MLFKQQYIFFKYDNDAPEFNFGNIETKTIILQQEKFKILIR